MSHPQKLTTKCKNFSQLLWLGHICRVSSAASLSFYKSACSSNRNTICLLNLLRKITRRILLRFVRLFYLGVVISVDLLNFSGFFLQQILFFLHVTVQLHQLNHHHLLWCWLPTFQQPDKGCLWQLMFFTMCLHSSRSEAINFKTRLIFSTPGSRVNPPSS